MSGKDIERAFKTASKRAGDKAISEGRTVVVKRGRRVISLTRDSEPRVVRSLPKAYVRNRTKTYKVK